MVHVVAVEKLAPSLVIPPQSSCLLVKADAGYALPITETAV
jgi:hypothetical protein